MEISWTSFVSINYADGFLPLFGVVGIGMKNSFHGGVFHHHASEPFSPRPRPFFLVLKQPPSGQVVQM